MASDRNVSYHAEKQPDSDSSGWLNDTLSFALHADTAVSQRTARSLTQTEQRAVVCLFQPSRHLLVVIIRDWSPGELHTGEGIAHGRLRALTIGAGIRDILVFFVHWRG